MNKSKWVSYCGYLLLSVISLVFVVGLCGCSDEYSIVYEVDRTNISCAWWGNDTRNIYTMNGIDIFRKRNPDINVECRFGTWAGYKEKQNIYMKSHNQPDVMLINYDWLDKYSADGNGFYDLYKLSDYIDFSNFSQEDLKYGEIDGKLNALPVALNTHIFYYNKGLFEKYNLNIPKTWDDLFKVAEVMRKDDLCLLSMNEKALLFFLLAYEEQKSGKKFCDDEGNFTMDRENIKDMLDFYKKVIDEKVVMSIDRLTSQSFYEEKVAGTVRWASSAEDYFRSSMQDKSIQVVIGDFPTMDGAVNFGWRIKPSTMYAMGPNPKDPIAAAKLLDFLINDPDMARLQRTEKGVPLSKSARAAAMETVESEIEMIANTRIIQHQSEMDDIFPIMEESKIYDTLQNQGRDYTFGITDLESATDTVFEAIMSIQNSK